jgi:hypothetical protein
MAGTFTDFLEKKLQDHVFGNTAYTAPSPVFLGLQTDSNTATQRDAGTVTEVSGGSYARVSVTNNTTNFPNAAGITALKNLHVSFAFPAPTANWGTVTSGSIWDASTAGNMLVWFDLTTPRTINNGDGAPSFAIDALNGTLD